MASVTPPSEPRPAPRRRRDVGRLAARVLCCLFALVGMIPLAGGFFLRSDPVHRWAAQETARLLDEHLGLEASYSLELSLWPLRLAVTKLVVPATDGGAPALSARTVAVRPRLFSLLAGRIDVGDIEIDELRARLVVREGQVVNVRYALPQPEAESRPLERAPFQTLALSDLRLDLDLDGTRVRTGSIDADVFAEPGMVFDLALRVASAELTHPRGAAMDEDVLCGLELRLRYEPKRVLVRRLSLLGLADLDPADGSRSDCQRSGEQDLGRVALRASQLSLEPQPDGLPHVTGHVFARVPAPLVNRFVDMGQVHGWVGFSGDVTLDDQARLPRVTGQLSGRELGLDGFRFAERLEAKIEIDEDVIHVPSLAIGFADGDVTIEGTRIAPFAPGVTLEVPTLEAKGVTFPGLMRDLDVTPDTIVRWDINDVLASDVRGTLSPFAIGGKVEADTDNFAVFDEAWHAADRTRMVGAGKARVSGRWRANDEALQFYDTHVSFGSSKLLARLVSIGFDNSLVLDVPEGAVIDLADVGPLGGLEVSGMVKLGVTMSGPASSAPLEADLAVERLSLGGFPIGDIPSGKARFEPLHVDFEDLVTVKGGSEIRLSRARLSFDGPASVAFDAHVDSERLAIGDFLDVWNMGDDPRYADIRGTGRVSADVHYVLGGPEDRCSSGLLKVAGRVGLKDLELFGERFSGADADLHLHWWDMEAGDNGYDLKVPSVTLRKGGGTLVGSVEVKPGAELSGHLIASAIPLSSVDALGAYGRQWDGSLSGVARLAGKLDALAVTANVDVSALKQGRAQLPASRLRVRFEPPEQAPSPVARSRCGNPVSPPFELAHYARDESRGAVHVAGEIWGGQVILEDLRISQQRSKRVSGKVALHRLDVGSIMPSLMGAMGERHRPRGSVSGHVLLEELWLDRPARAKGNLVLTSTELSAEGLSVSLASPEGKIVFAGGEMSSEGLAWSVRTPTGQHGIFDLDLHVSPGQQVRASLALRDTSLGAFAPLLPGVEKAEGTVRARLTAEGPWGDLEYGGSLDVTGGRLLVSRLESPIDALELGVALDSTGFTIRRGSARIGGGTLKLSGNAPLAGAKLGRLSVQLEARNVALPTGQGVRVTVDSDLHAAYDPGGKQGAVTLPRVTGTVDVVSAEYRRPMTVTADLAALTARGKKTEVDAYDPTRDAVELDILVRSKNAIRVENDLVEAQLRIDGSGLRVSGTDQRYGAVGSVHLVPGGRVLLRRNSFEVRQGIVRFNDPTRVAPQVDMTATTEYRRYDDPGRSDTGQSAVAGAGGGGASMGGSWRIHLHAYGEPENLRVDLTSDPALAQDDIFLLLTVGLTRAELDQTRSAGLGSSVALEALGTLSGADSVVTEAVPVIDDFRFGSAYSTRTGRTEPTVTIGKRLSERIRANVTTSLSDSSEVRSNLEWRMSPRVSIEGAYDNVKDIGSNSLGNVGGDVRWRLEFD